MGNVSEVLLKLQQLTNQYNCPAIFFIYHRDKRFSSL